MARFILKSKKYGELSFFVSDSATDDDTRYVYLESNKFRGTTGYQICEGGKFMGDTLCACPNTLESVARKWYKQRCKLLKNWEMIDFQ